MTSNDEGNTNWLTQAGGDPIAGDHLRSRGRTSLRWLGLLFLSTLLLLIFQVLLGWIARSITLLTDSAHSVADVVSYGLNLFVEWYKLAQLHDGSSSWCAFAGVDSATRLIDSSGAILSLITLVLAAWLSLTEAMERLSINADAPRDAGEDGLTIGRALLAFAVVSTGVNLGLLAAYQRFGRPKSDSSPSPVLAPGVHGQQLDLDIAPPPASPSLGSPSRIGNSAADVPPPRRAARVPPPRLEAVPGTPDAELPAPRVPEHSLRRARKTERRQVLNLCRDFSGMDAEVPVTPKRLDEDGGAGITGIAPCKKICCAGWGTSKTVGSRLRGDACIPQDAGPRADAQASSAGGEGTAGVLSILRFLMHPGCTCENHGGGEEDATVTHADPTDQAEGYAHFTRRNLNVFAAMLHLVADVLRGIVILVLACSLQLGCIKHVERADAYCAIVVAGLVGAGSMVLLSRAGAVLAKLLTFIQDGISHTLEDGQLPQMRSSFGKEDLAVGLLGARV